MNDSSNPNLRLGSRAPSHNSHGSHHTVPPQVPPVSQFGVIPQLPFMPFGGGPGSAPGSDYGQMPPSMTPLGFQNTGSAYGMMPNDPRNNMMANFNMFGGSGSQMGTPGGGPPSLGQRRPISTFSMATTANMFSGPSMNPNPTDEDLFNALRNYLSTQDLMTVTKK